MKRLFSGIAVDAGQVPGLVEKAASLRAANSELRWSDQAGWHATLQFYGMVDEGQEQRLRAQLRRVEANGLEVVVRGMGTFERAGVLWAGMELSEDLAELQLRVVAAGELAGFAREERPYRPHVTLARRKGRGGRWSVAKSGEMDAVQEFGRFRASEFVLYESVAGLGGARYEVIDRYGLVSWMPNSRDR